MATTQKISSLLLIILAFFSSIVWVISADDFLECFSIHTKKSLNDLSQVINTPKNSSYLSLYESGIQNLRFEASTNLKPIAIVTPLEISHIQASITCSKKNDLQLRVRSGGHDYESLSSVSETPFIIVDLRNMRSISIDTEKRTAWVQAGATLGELYSTIAEKSKTLAFVAGVCPTVGVGGHFSGGGYGMMSRKLGLASDNIIDAQLIDANGRFLDKKSMGEDLFWAIRGGGGTSFGIVLAWKINLHQVPEKVTIFNVTRTLEQNATKLIHRWQYVADTIDENLLMRLFIGSVNDGESGNRTTRVSFTSLYLGNVEQLLPLMKQKFPELGLVKEDCIEMSWISSILFFAGFQNGETPDVLRRRNLNNGDFQGVNFKGKSDFVTKPISENGLKRIWKWFDDEEGRTADLQFSPYGGKLSEIPISETPFPHRSGNKFMIHYAVIWDEEGEAANRRHLRWMKRFYNFMASYVSMNPRSAYFNYRDLDLGRNNEGNTSYAQARIWGSKYFKNNFKRLVHVKTLVDPSNFFRNEQSIPPLIHKEKKIGG